MTPYFADIKAILDRLVSGVDQERMKAAHHEPKFRWTTLEELKGIVVRPRGDQGREYPLIEQQLVDEKRGADTNLVRALRDPNGVSPWGQMPRRPPPGRLATPEEIALIVDWLNAGMPE